MKSDEDLNDDEEPGTVHYDPQSQLMVLFLNYLSRKETMKGKLTKLVEHVKRKLAPHREEQANEAMLPKYKLSFNEIRVQVEAEHEGKTERFIFVKGLDRGEKISSPALA